MLWQEECKFKIGDLVRINQRIDFFAYSFIVEKGDVGLIVGIDLDSEVYTLWGADYIVLIRDKVLIFFDSELELVNAPPEENTEK